MSDGRVLVYLLDLFGVAVFAVSGSLMAGRKRMDVFGVVVLAIVTAIGGGTLRDLLLAARPVFWVEDPTYVVVAAAASLATVVAARFARPQLQVLLVADAFGLALFTVLGAEKALASGAPRFIAVIMGTMTGVAGGIVRDVLCGEIPLIFRKEIYATASLLSGATFVALLTAGVGERSAIGAALIVGLALRLSAIRWGLSLPVFAFGDDS